MRVTNAGQDSISRNCQMNPNMVKDDIKNILKKLSTFYYQFSKQIIILNVIFS